MLEKLKQEVDVLRACGVEVDWLSVNVSDSGSYRAEHVLDYLEKTLLPWGPGRRCLYNGLPVLPLPVELAACITGCLYNWLPV